jgi:hypothetical protein
MDAITRDARLTESAQVSAVSATATSTRLGMGLAVATRRGTGAAALVVGGTTEHPRRAGNADRRAIMEGFRTERQEGGGRPRWEDRRFLRENTLCELSLYARACGDVLLQATQQRCWKGQTRMPLRGEQAHRDSLIRALPRPRLTMPTRHRHRARGDLCFLLCGSASRTRSRTRLRCRSRRARM